MRSRNPRWFCCCWCVFLIESLIYDYIYGWQCSIRSAHTAQATKSGPSTSTLAILCCHPEWCSTEFSRGRENPDHARGDCRGRQTENSNPTGWKCYSKCFFVHRHDEFCWFLFRFVSRWSSFFFLPSGRYLIPIFRSNLGNFWLVWPGLGQRLRRPKKTPTRTDNCFISPPVMESFGVRHSRVRDHGDECAFLRADHFGWFFGFRFFIPLCCCCERDKSLNVNKGSEVGKKGLLDVCPLSMGLALGNGRVVYGRRGKIYWYFNVKNFLLKFICSLMDHSRLEIIM